MTHADPTLPPKGNDADESARLDAVNALAFEHGRLPVFDDLAALAAQVTDSPMALVSMATREVLEVKGAFGCDIERIPRSDALCNLVVMRSDFLEIADCLADSHTADNRFVAVDDGLRRYAGIQLRSDGETVGVLCVCGNAPGSLTADQRTAFERVARVAEQALQSHRRNVTRARSKAAQFDVLDLRGIGVAVTDTQGVLLDANDALCQFLGRTRADAIGRCVHDFAHPDDPTGSIETVGAWLAGDEPTLQCEKRYLRPDGESAWGCVTAVKSIDADGNPFTVAAVQDITPSVTAEADLADRERRLNDAQGRLDRFAIAGSAGFWETIEPDGIVYLSPRLKGLLGYTDPGQMEDSREAFFALMHPDDVPGVTVAYHRMRDLGEPFRVRYRLRHRNGTFRWFAARGERFEHDGRIHCSGSIHDINDAHKLEERRDVLLRELEVERRRLEEIIEINPNLLFWKDRAGVYQGCNDATARMFGIPKDQLQGMTDADLPFAPEQVEAFRRDDEHVIRTGVPMRAKEEDVSGPGGSQRVFSTTKIPMRDADGNVIGVLGIAEDVTERKQAELDMILFNQKLVQATGELEAKGVELKAARDRADAATAAAQLANQAKSDFLANMSHEIRTPMSAILGYADLLRDESILPDDRNAHIATIRRNGEHLMSIINEILDLSKIEAGRMDVEQLEIELPTLLADVADLLKVRAAEKGIELVLRSEGPVPTQIVSDPVRLRQILLNLAGNALKFTEQGKVEIACELMPPDAAGKRMLRVFISDTGIGIHPDALGRLFESFEQADSSTTRRFGGTGLGLSISRQLAELLGGSIVCSSTAGKGTTFRVIIDPGPVDLDVCRPIDSLIISGSATAAVADRPSVPSLSGRVLLAEDGADNRQLLAHHLEAAGLDVTYVENGRDAIEAIAQAEKTGRPFDCLLLDMQMPVMDGYTAARQLRAKGYQRPIAALTANAMSGDRERCIAAGCDTYFAKPVRPAELYEFIESAIDTGTVATRKLHSSFVDDPMMVELVGAFVADLPEHVVTLTRELDRLPDADALRQIKRTAHQLKGAGGGYGFDAITREATVLENAVTATASPDAVRKACHQFIELLRRVSGYDPAAEVRAAA
ncbi:MAG: PAS domain S-box protein [Planctomycetota bacterium]